MNSYLTEIMLTTFQDMFHSVYKTKPVDIIALKEGASKRKIFRLSDGSNSCIAIYNENIKENRAFIEFTRTFYNYGLYVPKILNVSDDMCYYLEEDLGDITLYKLSGEIKNSDLLRYYEKALEGLLKFQVDMKNKVNYDLCYETKVFDGQQLAADLMKFDTYYLKQFGIVIDKKLKDSAFLSISKTFLAEDNSFFTYRDFQPRNVMLKDDKLYFIDYQSGRKGPLLYDLASFLYSGSINLSKTGRDYLLEHYLKHLSNYVIFSKKIMKERFYFFAAARILQILGSYGYTFKEKNDNKILSKIPKALKNMEGLKDMIDDRHVKEFIERLTPQKNFLSFN